MLQRAALLLLLPSTAANLITIPTSSQCTTAADCDGTCTGGCLQISQSIGSACVHAPTGPDHVDAQACIEKANGHEIATDEFCYQFQGVRLCNAVVTTPVPPTTTNPSDAPTNAPTNVIYTTVPAMSHCTHALDCANECTGACFNSGHGSGCIIFGGAAGACTGMPNGMKLEWQDYCWEGGIHTYCNRAPTQSPSFSPTRRPTKAAPTWSHCTSSAQCHADCSLGCFLLPNYPTQTCVMDVVVGQSQDAECNGVQDYTFLTDNVHCVGGEKRSFCYTVEHTPTSAPQITTATPTEFPTTNPTNFPLTVVPQSSACASSTDCSDHGCSCMDNTQGMGCTQVLSGSNCAGKPNGYAISASNFCLSSTEFAYCDHNPTALPTDAPTSAPSHGIPSYAQCQSSADCDPLCTCLQLDSHACVRFGSVDASCSGQANFHQPGPDSVCIAGALSSFCQAGTTVAPSGDPTTIQPTLAPTTAQCKQVSDLAGQQVTIPALSNPTVTIQQASCPTSANAGNAYTLSITSDTLSCENLQDASFQSVLRDQVAQQTGVAANMVEITVQSCTPSPTGPQRRRAEEEEEGAPADQPELPEIHVPITAVVRVDIASAPEVAGDPFVIDQNGKKVQFYLPLGKDTLLLKCGATLLNGRAFGTGIADDHQQWFDSFTVFSNGKEQLTVSLKNNSTSSQPVDGDDIDVSRGGNGASKPEEIGSAALKTLRVVVQGTVMKRTGAAVADDTVLVASWQNPLSGVETVQFSLVGQNTPNFVLQMKSAVAKKFNSEREQKTYLHLDLRFVELDQSTCTSGILAEIWGVAPMSQATAGMLQPPDTETGDI